MDVSATALAASLNIVTPTTIKQLDQTILSAYITATDDLIRATGLINDIELLITSIQKLVRARGVACPNTDSRYIEAVMSAYRTAGWNVRMYECIDTNCSRVCGIRIWY